MESSEYSEESLRRFFGERVDELNDDAKINLYKILVEYFLRSSKQHRAPSRFAWLNNEAEKNNLILKYISGDEERSSWDEKLVTRQYMWPESGSRHIAQERESNKFDDINSSIKLLKATIDSAHYKQNEALLELSDKMEGVIAKTASLSAEMHERYIPQSFGINPDEYPVSKFLPVKVYLSEYSNEKIPQIISSLGMFIDSIGFLFVDEFPSKKGSWWKNWFGKSKEIMTSEEFKDRLRKGERAIELAVLDKVQSEVNKNNSEAASNLIGALADVDNAAIQIGSLLLVKVTNGSTSNIHTRQLTNKEMILLEKNQSLLHKPTLIIEQLEKLSCENAA